MRYLFDTNLLSEFRRPARVSPHVRDWAIDVPEASIFVSVVTLFELERGARLMARRDARQSRILLEWLERDVIEPHRARIIAVDPAIARAAAGLHVPHPKPVPDAFIAATALVHGLTLATRNVRDFAGTGVALFDPWASPPD